MSVLEAPSWTSSLPHTSALAPDCSATGNFWGSGPSDISLVDSPGAAEALSLSLLLAIQPEWTPENRESAQVEQSQRVGIGRKRKMSSREESRQDQQPKRARHTESLDPPQFVAPHELTTSSGHSHSYTPSSESPEVGSMRHASHTPGYDHSRQMEARQSYGSSQYLQPHDSDWATTVHRPGRPVLPSISPRLETRVTSSYTMPPITTSYAPTMGPVSYQRGGWYDSSQPQQQQHHPHHHGISHSTIMSSMDPHHRQSQSQPHARAESDSTYKPRCFEHGCNGREFSTSSNLLRHQRERAGIAQKVSCPRCGAEFTRKTARDGHVLHAKCKPIRRSPDPGKSSMGGGHGGSQSGHRGSHGHIH